VRLRGLYSPVRLRIIKPVAGDIDGISLKRFRVGEIHEVGSTVGNYLLSIGAAVPVRDAAADENADLDPQESEAADRRTDKSPHE